MISPAISRWSAKRATGTRVIGHFVDRVLLENERGLGIGYLVVSILARIVLSILASIIVMWISRQRKFPVDAGAARLAGANSMVAALERLKSGRLEGKACDCAANATP